MPRDGGARLFEGVRTRGFVVANGRVTGVETDQGTIACEVVVNCAGQWARAVGALVGVNVPLHSAEHFYIVTKKIAGVTPDLPVLRDPDGYIYYKEEVGGLVMGGFEPVAKPWGMDGIPENFEFQLLPEDWDQFEILMTNALHRTPVLETGGGAPASQRTGELYARRQFHPGRSAGAARLLRLRRLQLGRHRQCRRRRAG